MSLMATDARAPLPPAEAARLTDFARAMKAAARAVTLYPEGHPAIGATLGRLVQLTSPESLRAPLRIRVLADGMQIDGQAPARPDASIGELAGILHAQLIGEIVVNAGGQVDDWRNFLLLVGRPAEDVRAEGGIARLWTTMAGRHVELREIDYAEVLREKRKGEAAAWDEVIKNCLHGDASVFDDDGAEALLAAAANPEKLAELMTTLDAKAAELGRGAGARAAALIRLMQGIVDLLTKRDPEALEPALQNLASAVGHVPPEVLVALLGSMGDGQPAADTGEALPPGAVVSSVISHMSDDSIANFVARSVMNEGTSIDRVAQAFQALVPDSERRERLLSMAHDDAAHSPLGAAAGFEDIWNRLAQKLMTSYSDKPYVSEAYARELSQARAQAISVEQVSDDPPERVAAWLGTVATSELRKLDLTLVLDLLRIEEHHERWSTLMRPVVSLLEDLFLVGDFDAAVPVLGVLVKEAEPNASPERRQAALTAIDVLVRGPMLHHISGHLTTIDQAQFERIKAMLLPLGEVLIRPLAEALSKEERARPRERLSAILIGFGAMGKREVERLKNSPNAAVRRTAIYLLREFGGSEALPELTELLADREEAVQREAIRAIANIGTDDAYQVLEKALTSGTAQAREAMMNAIASLRDERAAPLFVYLLQHVDHRGQLGWVYARAIESLGALKDADGVPALKDALYRGEWWAPRRTATLRNAAAAALARIASPAAIEVLEDASTNGTRSIRAIARTHLSTSTQRAPARAR
jgi:hypothetical protein